MLFNSIQFLIFFSVVFIAYWSMSRTWQNRFLVLASYWFYGAWNWKLLSLIMLTTAVDFFASLLIARERNPLKRKTFLIFAIAFNLVVLGFFKYYNFFVEDVFVFLDALGITYQPLVLEIVLPVGISFYTFQSMSYTIDVYRGDVEPTHDPIDYALYVSFFPQLVAGPIERAGHLLPQIRHQRAIRLDQFSDGLALVALGLFKKVVVADHLAMFVDAEFANQTGWMLLVALYFFAFQIYCDFSGYSDIARGLARLLGFDIRLNFDRPYLSQSLTEFWRRWHMSLSTWFRDYVYVPLGGQNESRMRTARNLFVVFVLSGLWHGASWTFVIWGALHGGMLVVEKALGLARPGDRAARPFWLKAVRIGVTFHFVVVAWVFFRSDSLPQAIDVLTNLFTLGSGPLSSYTALLYSAVALAGLMVVEFIDFTRPNWRRIPFATEGFVAATFVFILVWGQMNGGQFIYFQF